MNQDKINLFEVKDVKEIVSLTGTPPGMLEVSERIQLVTEACVAYIKHQTVSKGCIVDLGVFFGLSTFLMAKAVERYRNAANQDETIEVIGYDAFKASKRGWFINPLLDMVKNIDKAELLVHEEEFVDFRKITDFYLSGTQVSLHQTLLRSATPPNQPIHLLHIDAPKSYEDFRPILKNFFPCLMTDSVVIFQDFFYHWSGSLINAVGVLVSLGYLRMEAQKGTSLKTRVMREFNLAEFEYLDNQIRDSDFVVVFSTLRGNFGSLKSTDRSDTFFPRFELAELQLGYVRGASPVWISEKCESIFGRSSKRTTIIDLKELISYHFDVSNLYKADYPND